MDMNLNSRLFDSIRSRPKRAAAGVSQDAPGCQHPGCAGTGEHRAPKGRGLEGQYWRFCLEHVRAYNATYNYFVGMTDDAVMQYQKEAIVGHRPTWQMGTGGATRKPDVAQASPGEFVYDDPLGVFRAAGFNARNGGADPKPAAPSVGPVARRAYEVLGLDESVDAVTVKARYKQLVKQVHPDANGGDRSLEDRLREIINAYNTLKAAGRA
jgi:hypothetical protein